MVGVWRAARLGVLPGSKIPPLFSQSSPASVQEAVGVTENVAPQSNTKGGTGSFWPGAVAGKTTECTLWGSGHL